MGFVLYKLNIGTRLLLRASARLKTLKKFRGPGCAPGPPADCIVLISFSALPDTNFYFPSAYTTHLFDCSVITWGTLPNDISSEAFRVSVKRLIDLERKKTCHTPQTNVSGKFLTNLALQKSQFGIFGGPSGTNSDFSYLK